MSLIFPGDTSFPVQFHCDHCGEPLTIVGDKVVVCDCPESRKAQVTERERIRAFHRERVLQHSKRKKCS